MRFRTLTFSGSYATGGETITAQSVSLKRILAVIPADGVIAPAATATGSLYKIDVASDGRSVVIRFLNDAAGAAAATLGQEKTAGAHVAAVPAAAAPGADALRALLAQWPLWLTVIVSCLVIWRTRIHLLWLLAAGAVLGALGLI